MPERTEEEKYQEALDTPGNKEVRMYGKRDDKGVLTPIPEGQYQSEYIKHIKEPGVRPALNTGTGLVFDSKIVDKDNNTVYPGRHFKDEPKQVESENTAPANTEPVKPKNSMANFTPRESVWKK